MKTKIVVAAALIFSSTLIFCSKDNGTGPKDTTPVRNVKSFRIIGYNLYPQLPSFVNLMFQVSDLGNVGVDFLTMDRFTLSENDKSIDPAAVSLTLRKSQDIKYYLNTVILIDNTTASNIDAIKSAVTSLINKKVQSQTISIYTCSGEMSEVIVGSADKSALIDALNTIQASGETLNLYASLQQLLDANVERYEFDDVVQYTYVVIASSAEDKNPGNLMQVVKAAEQKRVYTVGIGSAVDKDALDVLGNVSFTKLSDAGQLTKAMNDIQEELNYWSKSFYWLSYATQVRKNGNNSVTLSISGNQNTDETATWSAYYASSGFTEVTKSLFINWQEGQTIGSDVLYVTYNTTAQVTATTVLATKTPAYTWSVENSSVVQIVPIAGTTSRIELNVLGNDGDQTNMTVTDTANDETVVVMVKISTYRFGTLLREVWMDIQGGSVSDLVKFPKFISDTPDSRNEITLFEAPSNITEYYGQRIRGYVFPPTTGLYQFWIASNDASELWLSTDTDPANKKKICYATTWVAPRAWEEQATQKSALIELQAGNAYYIEALMKERDGGDNLAVAWAGPGIIRTIPKGAWISPWIIK
jgi:hypothetical protein